MGVRRWWAQLAPKHRGYAVRLLVLLGTGITLLLWGAWPNSPPPSNQPVAHSPPPASSTSPWWQEQNALAQQLQQVLAAIPGVHDVTVAVQLRRSLRSQYLSNQDSTTGAPLVIQSNGGQAVVPLDQLGPEVQGVVVVTPSAANPLIRQELTEAVETLLGIAAYQVLVLPDGVGGTGASRN